MGADGSSLYNEPAQRLGTSVRQKEARVDGSPVRYASVLPVADSTRHSDTLAGQYGVCLAVSLSS